MKNLGIVSKLPVINFRLLVSHGVSKTKQTLTKYPPGSLLIHRLNVGACGSVIELGVPEESEEPSRFT
jgi:hypothetical protein